MNPSEVESMDPQQRCLLETSYRAFENAGLPMEKVAGSNTSVYVAALGINYVRMFEFDEEVHAPYKANGNSGAILANRLSWFYDLLGPSMTIETACSGSLISLHLACQSLHSKESKLSLVCGTNLYLEPLSDVISLSSLKFISPDSRCHSFDAKGNGYAKGDGFGVLVLKRLGDAVADGDVIRAVIRGTATNQDGHTPNMSQPSLVAQERLIRTAYQDAGLDFKETRLFEAHGPGTLMGDPIEANAIRNVFQKEWRPDDPLYIGSVKANIGHLEATAGLASVIKMILCLERGIIPPIAGFENLNPQISSKEWNLEFPKEAIPWPTDGLRRASVNAFGYGGSNAHAILDDAYNYLKERGIEARHVTATLPPRRMALSGEKTRGNSTNGSNDHITNRHRADVHDDIKANSNGNTTSLGDFKVAQRNDLFLFVYSAADSGGIDRLATVYKEYLSLISHEDTSMEFLRNLAYTLSNKRSLLPYKSYVLAETVQDLTTKLQNVPKPVRSSTPPKLLFVFTGQGAQWARMGIELSIFEKFNQSLQAADVYMRQLGSSWSLIEELQKPKEASRIDSPDLSQPLCTALQIALVELLASWGITPSGIVGHSSGEVAGAFSAGSISRESAWTIAYFRGALASRLATATANSPEKGAMMAVGLSESELQPYFEDIAKMYGVGSLSVACFNSSTNTTVSGLEKAIDELKSRLDADSAFARKLRIPVAYHSSHMQGIADEYLSLLQSIAPPPKSEKNAYAPSFVSSVTGKPIDVRKLSQPQYWVDNLVSPVRFSEAIKAFVSFDNVGPSAMRKANYFVEIGPHPAMQRAVMDSLENPRYGSTVRRDMSGVLSLKQLSGELWMEGFPVQIDIVNRHDDTEPQMITDLPEYPFNNSHTYWLESRLWKNYRTRENIRHELRGIPVTDWNPFEPRFRFTIRLSDLPWLTDHRVNGTILYPGAGLAIMAFEAARYLNKPGQPVTGYRLQNVSAFAAIPVPDTPEGVESQIYLRNQDNSRTTGSKTIECREFRICLYTENEWKEVSAGSVTTEYEEETPDEIYACDEASVFRDECLSRYQEAQKRCTARGNPSMFYESAHRTGYGFGPSFNTLHDVAYDSNGAQAIGTIWPDEWKSKVPEINANVQPHLIHPSALDGVFQVTAVATTKGGTIDGPLQAPTQFRDFWISHDLLSRTPDTQLQVVAHRTREAVRETESSILALRSDTGEPALTIDGYRATTVSHMGYTPSERRNIFYRLDWKADVDLLSRGQKENYILENEPMRVEWEPAKQVVVLYYMEQMLKELDTPGFQELNGHLQKYITWVRNRFAELSESNPLLQSPWKEILQDKHRCTQFLEDFAASGVVNRAIFTFIKELVPFIRGETDPLDLLFNQNLAKDLYADVIFSVSAKRMAAFIDLLAHKNSSMNILELGAGTGSGTAPILSALGKQGGHEGATPRFSSYTFTDISPSFFEKAKVQFAEYADRMIFQTLDIERDPEDQGFEPGKYDLVVAATMVHATECIAESLARARRLLKPGGYLVIIEPTNKKDIPLNGIWGTLSGWWRSTEADRSWSPLYSQNEWDHYLKKTGFTGCEAAITDFPDVENHTVSLIISRAASQEPAAPVCSPGSLLIVAETELQNKVAQEIKFQANSTNTGFAIQVVTPEMLQHQDLHADICMSLLEYGLPFLSAMSESDFRLLKQLVDTSSKICWVTNGAGEKAPIPENAMSSGFSRALIMEHQGVHMTNLNIDNVEDISYAAKMISNVTEAYFGVSDINDREGDYSVVDGTVLISRAVEANDINDYSHSQNANLPIERRHLQREPTEPLQVQFSPGQLDSFRFVRDGDVGEPLADNEVEVEVKASPINFKDVLVVLGQVTDNYIGNEFAGVVRRVGAGVKEFAPNDRVTGLASGTFKTFVRHQTHTVVHIPDDLPFVEALPSVWLTALYGLSHLGRLQKDESVLIHAAAGAVGQAAIQLAQHIGADIFVTVSSQAKKDHLQNLFNIPDNRFFSSRRLAFGKQIMRATNGRGVDVVLNSLSGEALVESWKCIASLGRFIEIGKRDMETFQKLPMHTFLRNVTFASVDLLNVYNNHPTLIKKLMDEMKELVFSKTLRAPQPVTLFSPADLESAFRYLQTGRHMGKAVINWEKEGEIPIIPTVDPGYQFDSQATYVIAGGLGGIGRSVASWFPTRGVKNLILLSRSGAVSESARELVNNLTARGVNVATPRCDISNTVSLEKALKECDHMPPIKGVIQGAMVLKDRPFDLMTKDEWQAVQKPKMTGTWNLHNKLPRDMDFFVILSSLGGMIGVKGQAQYNAAGTFQDAFARHRWSQGQKCISIDIGLVTAVGYVAEQQPMSGLSQRWIDEGFEVLREKELHSVVDWACNPNITIGSGWNTQVLSALNSPNSRLAQGKDLLPYMKRPMYCHLHQTDQGGEHHSQESNKEVDYGVLLKEATSVVEGGRIIASALAKRLSQALSVPEEDIDKSKPAHSFGVDSLVAVELRFWFATKLKVDLSLFDIIANISIEELGVEILLTIFNALIKM
ncbi:uncharacterized protein PFLUO_LOCUS994 [Penicillium psychrofluorescens]|uniref:uncharacterized protein n=1 Tax=Penicillium psychrofluorescens TaxID=3158075 RepID=UPI003CCCE9C7